ncbi:hypothetical protein [Clostridium acetireducens]
MYEYYPNTLMKLCIPTMMDYQNIHHDYLYKFFGFTDKEVEIIEESINTK